MTPAEVLSRLKAEGFTITRATDCVVSLDPPGAPAWLTAWLKEVPTPPWTNRILLLRALDLEEHPDSGRSVGSLPLMGEAYWIERAAAPHADPAGADFTLEATPET